jgi:hypothetical protein
MQTTQARAHEKKGVKLRHKHTNTVEKDMACSDAIDATSQHVH